MRGVVLLSLLLWCPLVQADNTPNVERSYTITVFNRFDADAVAKCDREKGRIFLSPQHSSKERLENGAWLCVRGNLIYPFVGESVVILEHQGVEAKR